MYNYSYGYIFKKYNCLTFYLCMYNTIIFKLGIHMLTSCYKYQKPIFNFYRMFTLMRYDLVLCFINLLHKNKLRHFYIVYTISVYTIYSSNIPYPRKIIVNVIMTNIFFVNVKIVIDLYKFTKPEFKITTSLSDMFNERLM
jgi:hypothetical protein